VTRDRNSLRCSIRMRANWFGESSKEPIYTEASPFKKEVINRERAAVRIRRDEYRVHSSKRASVLPHLSLFIRVRKKPNLSVFGDHTCVNR